MSASEKFWGMLNIPWIIATIIVVSFILRFFSFSNIWIPLSIGIFSLIIYWVQLMHRGTPPGYAVIGMVLIASILRFAGFVAPYSFQAAKERRQVEDMKYSHKIAPELDSRIYSEIDEYIKEAKNEEANSLIRKLQLIKADRKLSASEKERRMEQVMLELHELGKRDSKLYHILEHGIPEEKPVPPKVETKIEYHDRVVEVEKIVEVPVEVPAEPQEPAVVPEETQVPADEQIETRPGFISHEEAQRKYGSQSEPMYVLPAYTPQPEYRRTWYPPPRYNGEQIHVPGPNPTNNPQPPQWKPSGGTITVPGANGTKKAPSPSWTNKKKIKIPKPN